MHFSVSKYSDKNIEIIVLPLPGVPRIHKDLKVPLRHNIERSLLVTHSQV
jgi:hypothetical protein